MKQRTQERSHMSVLLIIVARASQDQLTWGNIRGHTQERSHTDVKPVTRAFQHQENWSYMEGHIQERSLSRSSPSDAMVAIYEQHPTLAAVPVSKFYIQERNHILAKNVQRHSLEQVALGCILLNIQERSHFCVTNVQRKLYKDIFSVRGS